MTTGHLYITRFNVFKAFKYVIYCLLTANIFLFLHEEFNASVVRFSDGISLLAIYQAFPQTIDTLAWVVLLVLFELETYVFDDRTLKGLRLWTIHGIRFACYVIIITAFMGYVSILDWLILYAPSEIVSACELIGQQILVDELNNYQLISADNCAIYSAATLMQHPVDGSFVSGSSYDDFLWLAWTDIINSATWIVVCLVLEFDVFLQLRHKVNSHLQLINRIIKTGLYAVLFWAAIYWGYTGSLLDFWDAFLWLIAFFLIELNLFDWQAEVEEAQSDASPESALTA
jgi:hypothetical protein